MNVFFFFGFLSCFLFEIYFSYLSFFLILSYVCCSTSLFLVSKNPSSKNTNFWSKGGLQHNGVFLSTCVLQNVKSYRFLGGLVLANVWLLFKKHYENRHFSTFSKQKITKKNGIFKCYYLVQVKCYYLVQVGCVLKASTWTR